MNACHQTGDHLAWRKLALALAWAFALTLLTTYTPHTLFAQDPGDCGTVLSILRDGSSSPPVRLRIDSTKTRHQLRDTVTVNIPRAGRYKLTARVEYNSGDEQLNESFFIEFSQNGAPFAPPLDPNARDGRFKVIEDLMGVDLANPYVFREIGSFDLAAGEASFRFSHFGIIAYDSVDTGNGFEMPYFEFVNEYPADHKGRVHDANACRFNIDCMGLRDEPESLFIDVLTLAETECSTDISLQQQLITSCVQRTGTYGYSYSVTNNGNQTARDVQLWAHFSEHGRVLMTDDLRRETELVRDPAISSDVYLMNIGDIMAGETVVNTIEFELNNLPEQVMEIVGTSAVIVAGDSDPSNNSMTVRSPVRSYDLALGSTQEKSSIGAGTRQRLSFSAANNGPDQAEALSLFVTLAAGIRAPDHIDFDNERAPNEIRDDGRVLVWTDARALRSGEQFEVGFGFTPPSFGKDTVLTFTAALFSDCDIDLANNNLVFDVTVTQGFNVCIEKQAITPQSVGTNGSVLPAVQAGGTFSYQIRAVNDGPDSAFSVVICDLLPASLPADSLFAYSPRPPDVVGPDVIAWNIPWMAPGEELTFQFKAMAPRVLPTLPFELKNTANVDAPGDINPNDNSDDAVVLVTPPERPFCEAFSLDRNIYDVTRTDLGALRIFIDLDRRSTLEIRIFDLAGTLVASLAENVSFDAGSHQLQWDGTTLNRQNAGSGVYVLTARRDNECCWLKFMVVR